MEVSSSIAAFVVVPSQPLVLFPSFPPSHHHLHLHPPRHHTRRAHPPRRCNYFPLAMVQTEQNLEQLGITLPNPPAPAANYIPCQRSGNILYLSGHLPLNRDGSIVTGRIGCGPSDHSVEHGYMAARQVGLNLIATLKEHLDGDLDRVERIVKLFGIVQSADDFHEQHKVVNGCSDVMVQVFGPERGLHARSAIGTNALPLNISVEIEAIVQIKPE